MSEFPQSLENFFLGDLIKDIDSKNKATDLLNENSSFKQFKENFDKANSESSNENLNDTSYTSSQNIISKEEIFSAISKQRTGILLQNSIKDMNSLEISNIIKELKGNFTKLMKDKNGNYFCSDLLKLCTSKQRLIILKEIIPEFISLSINQYSNHPIQILIELIELDEEIEYINYIFNSLEQFLNVCLNSNGSYVIQRIISNIPENKRNCINKLFLNCIHILSCDMYGVVALKKFVYYSNNEFIYKCIISNLIHHFIKISENTYGNYFVQYILEIWWNNKEMKNIKNLILFNFFRLSKNKFGSHICEMYIKLINLNEKQILLCNLMKNGIYFLLLKDIYGVFVMNKLINDCIINNSTS